MGLQKLVLHLPYFPSFPVVSDLLDKEDMERRQFSPNQSDPNSEINF
jgi:hypothetical protein